MMKIAILLVLVRIMCGSVCLIRSCRPISRVIGSRSMLRQSWVRLQTPDAAMQHRGNLGSSLCCRLSTDRRQRTICVLSTCCVQRSRWTYLAHAFPGAPSAWLLTGENHSVCCVPPLPRHEQLIVLCCCAQGDSAHGPRAGPICLPDHRHQHADRRRGLE